jgi:hypothetical protein
MAQVHASEAQHWYTKDGAPAYEVPAKDGSMRPTTLRDARKLGLLPSVTSIIKCAAAPGLQLWMQKQVMLAALTLPRQDGESEDDYLQRILRDSKEQARKAAERGTAIHAAIQGNYEGQPPHEEYWEHVYGAVQTVGQWLDGIRWTAERSFASALGYGGKVDLSSSIAVLDFKTKEFGPDDDLKTWDEHAMQLAAYRHGLEMPQARCAIVYVSVTHPGLSRLIEIPQEELEKGWKCFYSLLQFWKAAKGYECSFDRLLAA